MGRLGAKDTGGMSVYIRQLGRQLGRRGVQVDVFTFCHDTSLDALPTPQDEDLRVIHLNASNPRGTPKQGLYRYLPQFTTRLLEFQEKHGLQYDLIHSHYWLSGWVGERLRGRWGVPHLTCFHTLGEVKNRTGQGEREPRLRIETEGKVAAAADRVIAFSSHEREALDVLYGVPPQKVEIVPCGVDLEQFRPVDKVEARARLGLGTGKVVLYVGRIEALKGIDVLLRAAAALGMDRDWRLLIVGGDGAADAELARLRQLSPALGIGDRVSFLGPVPHEMLPLYYSAANVLVLPSYYESFGLVLLEALACSTPVVASAVGEIASIVHHDQTGLLVEPGSPESLLHGLKRLLDDEALERRLAAAARGSVQRYSWGAVAERLLEVYGRLLDGPAVDSGPCPMASCTRR